MGVLSSILSFYKKIKSLFDSNEMGKDPKYRNFVENVIPSLKFGDIIYAQRFNNDIEKENMGVGHTEGPFIVISFDEDKIIGAYCTSNENVKGGFQIGENYNLFYRDKKTYMTVLKLKTIDYEAFISKSSKHLSESDIKKIKKKLYFMNTRLEYDDFGLRKNLQLDFSEEYDVNDVVNYRGAYYIIIEKKDNDIFMAIPILGYNQRHSCINFLEVKIDCSNVIKLKKGSFNYLNTIVDSQMKIIMNAYNEYIKRKNDIMDSKIKKLDRGCLVKIFNKLKSLFAQRC